ncbi:MAG: nitroreductase family protein [Bosea sp. (in: a-proteobacteria)]
MPVTTNETLELLRQRRSVPPNMMTGPAPSAEEQAMLLEIASRVPDHGRLVPWRFLVLEGEGRVRAGQIVGAAFKAANPQADEEKVAYEAARLTHAPLVIGVISTAGPHVKIPEWEQVLTAGAVCMNLVVAANAMGFAANWLTNWFSFDRGVLDALGLGAGERMAGFVHIGRSDTRPADRERPDVAALTTRFGA